MEKNIIGDEINTVNPYPMYNMEEEFTAIYSQATEHIKKCLSCGQRATRHHLSIGNPLDEENMKQAVAYITNVSELSHKILNHVNSILQENQKQIKEMREMADLNKENMENITEKMDTTVTNHMKKYIKYIAIVSTPAVVAITYIISLVV